MEKVTKREIELLGALQRITNCTGEACSFRTWEAAAQTMVEIAEKALEERQRSPSMMSFETEKSIYRGLLQEALDYFCKTEKAQPADYTSECWSYRAENFLHDIITTHVHPPIPCRNNDWCAYYKSGEESCDYGWGKTELEAVENLLKVTKSDWK